MSRKVIARKDNYRSDLKRDALLDRVLPRHFYRDDTITVAKKLLGKWLVREIGSRLLMGRIVEVEGYRGFKDPASHAYGGVTPRNRVMFGEPGLAYVYFTYGMHYCLNVTAETVGIPGAVLIRAVHPILGIADMMKNRRTATLQKLTSGPARLTEAMKITSKLNGHDMTIGEELYITAPEESEEFEIVSSRRIGIKFGLDREWRFYAREDPFVSSK